MVGIFLFGTILRLVAFASLEPRDDLWRYLWEGRTLWQGGDPWTEPPNSQSWGEDSQALRDRINHPGIPAIYPPLVLGFFALLAGSDAEATGFRLAMVVLELLAAWIVLGIARREGSDGRGAFAIAWLAPLAIVEIAGKGHLEAMVLVAVALWARSATAQDGPWLRVVSLALLLQTKIVTLVLFLADLAGSKTGRLRSTLASIAAGIALGLLPYGALAWSGVDVAEVPLRFGTEFSSHDWLPHLLSWWDRFPEAGRIASIALFLGGVAILGRREPDPIVRGQVVLFLLVSALPTFHAWYALWILSLVALRPTAWGLAFVFTALAYEVGIGQILANGGVWREIEWVRWAVWAPPWILFGRYTWSSMSSYRR